MKVTFLSTAGNLTALSSRVLCSYVKQMGHEANIVFLPSPGSGRLCSERAAEAVAEVCQDSDFVGLTVFTIDYHLAIQLTNAIHKRTSAKVIWGGIHPTVRVAECLEHADFACVGEGESVMQALLNGADTTNIQGLWYKQNGAMVDKGVATMVEDLKTLPFQDFSFQNHYIVENHSGDILTGDAGQYQRRCGDTYYDMGGSYQPFYMTMSSRGCPFACTFCANEVYHDMYTIKHYRLAPVSYLLDELEAVTSRNPFIGIIYLIDDSFFSRSQAEIEGFSASYKERIGLPFHAVGYPSTIKKEKLDPLVNAGLSRLSMGIQTGSAETLKRYKRPGSKVTIMKAVKLINSYKGKILPPKFDIISNDPFQSIDEQRDSIRFLTGIPGSFANHSLLLFPGTSLNDLAKKKGLLASPALEGYIGYHFTADNWYDILVLCLNLRLAPRRLVRAAANNRLYHLAEKAPVIKRLALKMVDWLRRLEQAPHNLGLWFKIRYRRLVGESP